MTGVLADKSSCRPTGTEAAAGEAEGAVSAGPASRAGVPASGTGSALTGEQISGS